MANIGINRKYKFNIDKESFIELRQMSKKEHNQYKANLMRLAKDNEKLEDFVKLGIDLFDKLVVKIENCFDNETKIDLDNYKDLIPNDFKSLVINRFLLENNKISDFEKN